MTHTTHVTYEDEMTFDVELDGHHLKIDADEKFGGRDKGPKPKHLLLAALAGCTGMDVVSILKKMRMPFDRFWLDVEGTVSESEPKVYNSFTVTYNFQGGNLDREKIEKAVTLSQENYCGVSAMFRSFAPVNVNIVCNP